MNTPSKEAGITVIQFKSIQHSILFNITSSIPKENDIAAVWVIFKHMLLSLGNNKMSIVWQSCIKLKCSREEGVVGIFRGDHTMNVGVFIAYLLSLHTVSVVSQCLSKQHFYMFQYFLWCRKKEGKKSLYQRNCLPDRKKKCLKEILSKILLNLTVWSAFTLHMYVGIWRSMINICVVLHLFVTVTYVTKSFQIIATKIL